MSEEHTYEVDLIVRGAGQPDTVISREYQSQNAASTDKAAREIWEALGADAKARMRGVNDGR